MSEHTEQCALFDWAESRSRRHPELKLMFAVPNGGARHIAVGRKLKAEGVKAGVPDIFLPVPRNGFHGLFIEMKFGKNKMTTIQQWWKVKLQERGYQHLVCYGWEEASVGILEYLEKK